MFEITVTFTRQDTKEEWFIFHTFDKDLLYAHNLYRNEIVNAPGFISMSYVMSPDKLQLKVITLWDSQTSGANFKNSHNQMFTNALRRYMNRAGVTKEVSTCVLPDTPELKAQKLSSRMTVDEAGFALRNFIVNAEQELQRGQHTLFLNNEDMTDEYDPQ